MRLSTSGVSSEELWRSRRVLSAEAVTPLTEVSENDPYSSLRTEDEWSVFSATTQATTGNTSAVRRLRILRFETQTVVEQRFAAEEISSGK